MCVPSEHSYYQIAMDGMRDAITGLVQLKTSALRKALREIVAAAEPVDSDAKANYQEVYGGLVYTCMIRAKDMDKFLAAVERAQELCK